MGARWLKVEIHLVKLIPPLNFKINPLINSSENTYKSRVLAGATMIGGVCLHYKSNHGMYGYPSFLGITKTVNTTAKTRKWCETGHGMRWSFHDLKPGLVSPHVVCGLRPPVRI